MDDPNRLRSMVADHFDFIWRSLKRHGVRDGDVDDLVQRVFLTASRRIREIRPGAERAFLFAVALREAGHVRRSYRRRGEVGAEALLDRSTGAPRPDDVVGQRQNFALIDAALQELEDDLRTVFVLFEIEEMPAQQIAALLDIPLGTVKSRLRRAREDFKKHVEGLHSGLGGEV